MFNGYAEFGQPLSSSTYRHPTLKTLHIVHLYGATSCNLYNGHGLMLNTANAKLTNC